MNPWQRPHVGASLPRWADPVARLSAAVLQARRDDARQAQAEAARVAARVASGHYVERWRA